MTEELLLKLSREHGLGIACIAISLAVLCITPSFPKGQASVNITGPAFFPNVLAVAFIILGTIQLIAATRASLKSRTENAQKTKPSAQANRTRQAIEFIILIVAFIFAFEPLGFFTSTIVFLFLLMLLLGLTWWKSLLYSLIFTAVIYLLFGVLFTIGLPAGIISFLGL
jgi:putative tricarboxylic transport membrane protein